MDWGTAVFEWDEAKRRSNLGKHGIDFRDAAQALGTSPQLTYDSSRGEEKRHVGIVEINGLLVAIVHTWRGEAVRIISARRARGREERDYRALFGR
ncbi:BrnT family toxin [Xanthobacter tagetidis]|jgi:uncharacterized DUF497 family protein|uniref:BrnT family toxin n=1 Tax=Xanthobacter tagetidis TaxID=60216 RepID=A0A3L6ZWW1_9HYPH|nr:BrnT family toxin [Xanthobacter tagetidis]MBB6307042.1 hypothetical protein [Xanthobacter tagetidis]RLP72254.1 BrnT family toxin [Xanthobacter tagetidis]